MLHTQPASEGAAVRLAARLASARAVEFPQPPPSTVPLPPSPHPAVPPPAGVPGSPPEVIEPPGAPPAPEPGAPPPIADPPAPGTGQPVIDPPLFAHSTAMAWPASRLGLC